MVIIIVGMVRVKAKAVTRYRPSMRKGRKFGPNRSSVNILATIASAQNSRTDATSVQAVLTNHFPGAVTGWNNVAYKLYTGRELVNLVNTAFQNTTQIQISGVKVYGQTDNSSTLAVCFRQAATDHLRVVTGIGRLRALFNFKNKELPQYILLIGETDASFKITFYYSNKLVTAHL